MSIDFRHLGLLGEGLRGRHARVGPDLRHIRLDLIHCGLDGPQLLVEPMTFKIGLGQASKTAFETLFSKSKTNPNMLYPNSS